MKFRQIIFWVWKIDFFMILKERLKELRIERGLKQKDVAEALEISVSCYGGYEQGYREPDLKTLIKICKLFETSSDFLLGLSDY